MKRSLSDPDLEVATPKKKSEKMEPFEFVSCEVGTGTAVNKESQFQTFIQGQVVPYEANLSQTQTDFSKVDNIAIIAAPSENQYINFQDEQLLHSALENSSTGKFFIRKTFDGLQFL